MKRRASRPFAAALLLLLLVACGTTVPQTTVIGGGSGSGDANTSTAGGIGGASNDTDGEPAAAATDAASPVGAVTTAAPSSAAGALTTTSTSGSVTSTGPAKGGPSAASSATRPGSKAVSTSAAKAGAGKASAAPSGSATSGKSAGGGATKTGAASTAAATGRGFTASTIDIGFSDSDLSTYSKTLGLKGVSTGDTKAQIAALAKYINAHGGILGRQIVPREYTYSTQEQLANADQAGAEACAAWTQDDKVFAVVNSGLGSLASGIQCMANASTPTIDAINASQFVPGVPTSTKYASTYFTPATFTAEKLAPLYVGMMQRTKYLTGWNTTTATAGTAPVKVGIIVNNDPIPSYASQQIINAVRAVGVTLDDADVIRYDDNLSSATSQSEAAVVKFRSDGVTHVITSDVQLAETAESQKYYPRFAFESEPQLFGSNYNADQLAGSVGLSALPAIDANASNQPPVQNPTQALCQKIMTDAQQDITDLSALSLMEQECDEMFSLANALNRAGSISNDALRGGYEEQGKTDCASTFLCQQGPLPTGHASSLAVRDMVFMANCTCFTYTDNVNHTS